MLGNQQPSRMRNQSEGSTTRLNLDLDNLDPIDSSFLRGCLIGDGWLGLQRKKSVHLRIGHSAKQLEWLEWKASRINRILHKNRPVLGPYQTKDSNGNSHLSYLYCVDDHKLLSPWFNRWYAPQENQKTTKKITPDFLNGLDLQALAILWCDDGSLWHSNRVKNHRLKTGELKRYPYLETAGSIATCCFTNEENILLAGWIEGLTGVKPKISKTKNYLILRFCKSKLLDFIPQIEPFVPDCMSYKVDLSPCFM
jgi:hypothetical protein